MPLSLPLKFQALWCSRLRRPSRSSKRFTPRNTSSFCSTGVLARLSFVEDVLCEHGALIVWCFLGMLQDEEHHGKGYLLTCQGRCDAL
jgi:hypothetical protein